MGSEMSAPTTLKAPTGQGQGVVACAAGEVETDAFTSGAHEAEYRVLLETVHELANGRGVPRIVRLRDGVEAALRLLACLRMHSARPRGRSSHP